MPDDHTYGASRSDMGELLNMIGGGDVEFPQRSRGGGGATSPSKIPKLVRFTANGYLTSGTCSADFIEMAGGTLETATLRDPQGIFVEVHNGVTGLAILQDGLYYAIQANCPDPDYV